MKATKTAFTAEELESIADAILLRNGYDKDGRPLTEKKKEALILEFKKIRKIEIPAVG